MDCIFCKIVGCEIPSDKIYEDEFVFAFSDLSPEAPVHFLIVPKVHIASVDEISAENSKYIAKIFEAIPKICKDLGITDGYRVVTNTGKDAGQTVSHLHYHVLAKRNLSWPPG